MRVLIIADMHANQPALDAVLQDAGDFDIVLNLGDTVGYGPFPSECVNWMQEVQALQLGLHLVGNHDLAVLGQLGTDIFTQDARLSCTWSAQQLSPQHRAFLHALGPMMRLDEDIVLFHGSARDPVREYITSVEIARASLACCTERLGLMGHSHVPFLYAKADGGAIRMSIAADGQVVDLSRGQRWLINPGSVGQPRDHDPPGSLWHLR